MASHKSAEKKARQDAKRRDRNRALRSSTRTALKKARSGIAAGDDPVAASRDAESSLRRAASKGVIPKRRASRLVSRIARAAAKKQAPPKG